MVFHSVFSEVGIISHLLYLFLQVSNSTLSAIPLNEALNGFTSDGELFLFHASTTSSLGNQVTLRKGREEEGGEGGGEREEEEGEGERGEEEEGEGEGEGEREEEGESKTRVVSTYRSTLPQQLPLSLQPHTPTPGLSPYDLARGRGLCLSH